MIKKSTLLTMETRRIGRIRVEYLEGRPHYVFKVRMWKPGVVNSNDNHNGGASYFPRRQMVKVLQSWDHRPVVLNHPQNRVGKWVSACSPQILNETKVGVILNNRMADSGFQESEAWIDKRRIDALEPRFKKLVKDGSTIEVSTGCRGDCVFESGHHEGKRYDQVIKNIVPDHLALLFDDKGACSCADGCGMFTQKRKSCNCHKRRSEQSHLIVPDSLVNRHKSKRGKRKKQTRKRSPHLVAPEM